MLCNIDVWDMRLRLWHGRPVERFEGFACRGDLSDLNHDVEVVVGRTGHEELGVGAAAELGVLGEVKGEVLCSR